MIIDQIYGLHPILPFLRLALFTLINDPHLFGFFSYIDLTSRVTLSQKLASYLLSRVEVLHKFINRQEEVFSLLLNEVKVFIVGAPLLNVKFLFHLLHLLPFFLLRAVVVAYS